MQFGGGKFNHPGGLVRAEASIHKLSIQCKTENITFRETVAYDIGQEPGWIDSRGGLAGFSISMFLMNLTCEAVRYISVK
jgi:hypothetical protein